MTEGRQDQMRESTICGNRGRWVGWDGIESRNKWIINSYNVKMELVPGKLLIKGKYICIVLSLE